MSGDTLVNRRGTVPATYWGMSLITLLVLIIVIGMLVYLVQLLPLPAPFKTIAMVIVILVCIVWLLNVAGLFPAAVRIR